MINGIRYKVSRYLVSIMHEQVVAVGFCNGLILLSMPGLCALSGESQSLWQSSWES